MKDISNKYLKVIANMQASVNTIEEIPCTCNEYSEHTCDRCILINKLNFLAIDASEVFTRALKGDVDNG